VLASERVSVCVRESEFACVVCVCESECVYMCVSKCVLVKILHDD
jgi:hypothetical protein